MRVEREQEASCGAVVSPRVLRRQVEGEGRASSPGEFDRMKADWGLGQTRMNSVTLPFTHLGATQKLPKSL